MIIDLKKLSNKDISETSNGIEMKLSDDATTMVFQMFINHNYSNPIGSICREIASNCFDSHIESNCALPVLIKKSHDAETDHHYVSFIDFGVGISPERMGKIYGVLFESTKRASATQIGGYGIGSKSPLAYKRKTGLGSEEYDNSFYVITVCDGMKYYYCIYEGVNCPVINLLHSESTTESNGTEVRIQIAKGDIQKFENELFRQLYYFENIVFEGFENYNGNLTNDYKIVKAENFIYRGDKYAQNIHVCLGKVAYRIDYDVVDIPNYDYKYPIALKFDIGELNVTKSREDLDYSEETIKKIKDKIALAKLEIGEMVNKQHSNVIELVDYFNEDKKNLVLRLSSEHSFRLDKDKFKIVYPNFKYSHLNLPTDNTLFTLFYNVSVMGKKESRSDLRYGSNIFTKSYESIVKSKNVYYLEHDFEKNNLLTSYIRSINDRYYIIFMKKAPNISILDIQKYFKDCIPTNIDIDNLYNDFTAIVKSNTIDYDGIKIPEAFIAEKKIRRSKSIETGSVVLNLLAENSRVIVRSKISDIINFNGTIFYGNKNDYSKLLAASTLFEKLFNVPVISGYGETSGFKCNYYNINRSAKPNAKIMFVYVAEGNLKFFKRCKKAYTINQFDEKMLCRKHDIINKAFATKKINEKKSNINSIFLRSEFSAMHPELASDINKIINFNKSYSTTITNNIYSIEMFMTVSQTFSHNENKIIETINKLIEMSERFDTYLNYVRIPSFYSGDDHSNFWKLIGLIDKNL